MIVGSILLAFAIDASWQGAQERMRAQDLLLALTADATANLEDAEAAIAAAERTLARAVQARELLGSGWEEVPRDSVIGLLALSGSIRVLSQVTGTYDQLVTTGDLRLLDQAVRDALSSWQKALDRSLAQEAINTESRTAFQPYRIENLAVAELIGMSRPDRVSTPARFTNDIGALAADRRLDNLLTYTILLSGDLAGQHGQLRAAVISLLNVLRSVLEEG